MASATESREEVGSSKIRISGSRYRTRANERRLRQVGLQHQSRLNRRRKCLSRPLNSVHNPANVVWHDACSGPDRRSR